MTELADALSDLQALKKLYGLLLNQDNIQGGENFGNLDEKSRILLKKLLDRAAETALDGKTSTRRNSTFSSLGSQVERKSASPIPQTGKETENLVFCSSGIQETSRGERGLGRQKKKIYTGWCESKKEPEVSSSSTTRGGGFLKSISGDTDENTRRPENRVHNKDDFYSLCRHCGKLPEHRGKPEEGSDNGARVRERVTSKFHQSQNGTRTLMIGSRPVCIPSDCSKLDAQSEAWPSPLQRFHGATPLVRDLCLKRSRSTKTDISEQSRTGARVATENQKQRDITSSSRFRGDSSTPRKMSNANRGKAPRLGTEKDTGTTQVGSLVKDTRAFHGRFVNRGRAQNGDEGVCNGRQMGKSIHQSQGTKESKNGNATNTFSQPLIRTVVPKTQKDTITDRLSSRITIPLPAMEEANLNVRGKRGNQSRFDPSRFRTTGEINPSAATQTLQNRQKRAESDAASGSFSTRCNRPGVAEHALQKQRREALPEKARGTRNSDTPTQLIIAASKRNPRCKFDFPDTEKKVIGIRDGKNQQKQYLHGQRTKKLHENPIEGRNPTKLNRNRPAPQGWSRQANRDYENKRLTAKEEAWTGTNADSPTLETSGATDSSLSRPTSSSSCSVSGTPTTASRSSGDAKEKNAKNRILLPSRPYIGPTFLSRSKSTLLVPRTTRINQSAKQRQRRSLGISSASSSSSSSSSSSPSRYFPRTSVHRRLQETEPIKRPGRLRRLKNKLSVIFHHHHHHHHHHHRSEGSDSDATSPDDRAHRSFWRYIRKAVHRKPEQGKKPAAEEFYCSRPARALGNPARRPEHGYLYSLMESFLRHVWRRSRTRGNAALNYQKSLRKIGESLRRGKARKLGLWQNLHRRGGGVKLENRKKPRIAMGRRRSHKKS